LAASGAEPKGLWRRPLRGRGVGSFQLIALKRYFPRGRWPSAKSELEEMVAGAVDLPHQASVDGGERRGGGGDDGRRHCPPAGRGFSSSRRDSNYRIRPAVGEGVRRPLEQGVGIGAFSRRFCGENCHRLDGRGQPGPRRGAGESPPPRWRSRLPPWPGRRTSPGSPRPSGCRRARSPAAKGDDDARRASTGPQALLGPVAESGQLPWQQPPRKHRRRPAPGSGRAEKRPGPRAGSGPPLRRPPQAGDPGQHQQQPEAVAQAGWPAPLFRGEERREARPCRKRCSAPRS